jgi:ribosomal protein S1
VIGVDRSRRNVSLSLRALQKDPLLETIESQEWRSTAEVREDRAASLALLEGCTD